MPLKLGVPVNPQRVKPGHTAICILLCLVVLQCLIVFQWSFNREDNEVNYAFKKVSYKMQSALKKVRHVDTVSLL